MLIFPIPLLGAFLAAESRPRCGRPPIPQMFQGITSQRSVSMLLVADM